MLKEDSITVYICEYTRTGLTSAEITNYRAQTEILVVHGYESIQVSIQKVACEESICTGQTIAVNDSLGSELGYVTLTKNPTETLIDVDARTQGGIEDTLTIEYEETTDFAEVVFTDSITIKVLEYSRNEAAPTEIRVVKGYTRYVNIKEVQCQIADPCNSQAISVS